MKKIISLLCALVLIASCTKEPNYEIPLNADGTVYLTGISSTTTTGISTLDGSFSVTATLPNAKSGDVMNVECLQLQLPSGGTTTQLLPLEGSQKTATVGDDLKASITYTRDEAKLTNLKDYVVVAFNGKTDDATQRVDLVAATTVSNPNVSGIDVAVARTPETAYFNVTVVPKAAAYAGTLVVKMKNGINDSWVALAGSPFSGAQPYLIPISGNNFAAGKDTMYYSFTTASGSYIDEILKTIIVRDPYFYLKKTATLTLNESSAGRNLLINAAVAENAVTANVAVSGSLILKGGSAWLSAGKTINFVPSTLAMYEANNSANAIEAFNAGVPTTTADPIAGEGVYIFKIINGLDAEDVYYGMMKITSILPGVSVTFDYRIGDQYAHLTVIR